MKPKTTLILAAMMGTSVAALAQAPSILYLPGKSAADQQIGFRSWGSGLIHESTDAAYEGSTSISVSSRNLFQGGIMLYAVPIDLSAKFGDKDNLLRITFKMADSSTVLGGGGPAGGTKPGGQGSNGGGGLTTGGGGAGGATAGGPPGGGGPPGSGLGSGGGSSSGGTAHPVRTMRMIVTTSDGKKSEIYIPVSTSMAGDRGWKMVSIPLQAIRGFDQTNKTVKELAFSADETTTFYLGDIRVVNDSTKVTGEIVQKGPFNFALGDELTLSGYGFAGSSPLKFQWDFDSKDGIQVDAEGQTIKRKFRKPGRYTITLTVSDMYGLKAPATSTVDVTVNP